MLLAGAGVGIFAYKREHTPLKNPQEMRDLVGDVKDIDNIYASVDINNVPVMFAVYQNYGIEEDSKYYLAMDNHNILYIIYMNSKEFKEIEAKKEDDFPITITGTTRIIPNDIKKLAIDEYNKVVDNDYLTLENFEDYVGEVLLDTNLSPYNSFEFYILASVLLMIFLSLFIVFLIRKVRTNKILKRYSEADITKIYHEVQILKSSPYEKIKLYLTSNYVVDLSKNIIIINYQDIILAYKYEYRYNGITVNKYIKILTSDNKTYNICNTNLIKENKEKIIDEVLKKLQEKNSKILIGMTKDNKEKALELIKINKSI